MAANKITAAEARKIALGPVDEMLELAYTEIRKAAEKGRTTVNVFGEWQREGYNETTAFKKAKKVLEDDGFKVKYFYEEKQFVDMGITVSWGE